MTETWKPICGYEGLYEVSDAGRVRSLTRKTPAGVRLGRVLKPYTCMGYLYIALYAPSSERKFRIHRLVLGAFTGPCPQGMEACHGNGDRTDNRLANLRWDTRSRNAQDRIAHGTQVANSGQQNGQAKLTEEEVGDIYGMLARGATQRAVSILFDVSKAAISAIACGKNWSHMGLRT